ncbi:MAG TPA: tetratricopeptide repeat protein [Anaeromyxobacteraceae bacterium]|nr:tetratricopeptide repeat protein [Anaeromyxobacteraceae bacterium]
MTRRQAAKWAMGFCLSLVVWPFSGFGFAAVAVGDSIENVEMPVLGGGKQPLMSSKSLANVIIFFRPHHDHSLDTLKAMAQCEKEFAGKPVHWVAVVSGSYSADEVKATVNESAVKMPVLIDENDALYGRMGVRLHPSVGIANEKFQLVAYEPFLEVNYCDRIRGKVRYALHEIGEAEVAKIDNPQRALMPNDMQGAVANRHVKMGEMYIAMKQPDKAAAEARQILATDPRFAPAHLLLGDALAAQGKCEEAAASYATAQQLDPKLAPAIAEKRRACGSAPSAAR